MPLSCIALNQSKWQFLDASQYHGTGLPLGPFYCLLLGGTEFCPYCNTSWPNIAKDHTRVYTELSKQEPKALIKLK